MSKRVALLTTLLLACKPSDVTPSGTKLAEWAFAKTTKPELQQAKIEATERRTYSVELSPSQKEAGPVALTLAVDIAGIETREMGRQKLLRAPIQLTLTIAANKGWRVESKCETEPSYQAAREVVNGQLLSPSSLYAACHVQLSRGEAGGAHGAHLRIYGDGVVTYDGNYDTAVVITPSS